MNNGSGVIRNQDRTVLRQSVRAFLSEFGGDSEILKNKLLTRLKIFIEKDFCSNIRAEDNLDMNSELNQTTWLAGLLRTLAEAEQQGC